MGSESALSFSALFLSYLLKSAAAYLGLGALSRYIQNSQVRFTVYALFLGGLVAGWILMFVLPHLPAMSAIQASIVHIASARHLSLSLSPAACTIVAKSLSPTLSAYVVVVAFLLLRFLGHFWRVRSLLRASQKSPAGLSELFESVYSASGAPRCELRLVNDVRSPATTGWWHPKVLLPRYLVPRLNPQQLSHILQHELMHVRRRDYLWDRLSTLGCYLIFFHPLAWLARRHLRWERELVCDESVAQDSRDNRVEYAGCLTTLASWWFLAEETAGQVDFVSSPSSLLATRVRALLVQAPTYNSCKKTALILIATGASILPALLIPEIAISSYRPAPLRLVTSQALRRPERTGPRIVRSRVSKLREHEAFIIPARYVIPASDVESSPTPPTLNFPLNPPVLYSTADQVQGSVPDVFESLAAEAEGTNLGEGSQTTWDESLPQPHRRRVSKIGAIARRVLKLGISVAATQIGDHDHSCKRKTRHVL
jgi:beta-lactamase regulating signal transducer with metallopeptidase domain